MHQIKAFIRFTLKLQHFNIVACFCARIQALSFTAKFSKFNALIFLLIITGKSAQSTNVTANFFFPSINFYSIGLACGANKSEVSEVRSISPRFSRSIDKRTKLLKIARHSVSQLGVSRLEINTSASSLKRFHIRRSRTTIVCFCCPFT